MPPTIDSERSTKRRKLETPTRLPAQSSAAAKLAELRRSKSKTPAKTANGERGALAESATTANGKRRADLSNTGGIADRDGEVLNGEVKATETPVKPSSNPATKVAPEEDAEGPAPGQVSSARRRRNKAAIEEQEALGVPVKTQEVHETHRGHVNGGITGEDAVEEEEDTVMADDADSIQVNGATYDIEADVRDEEQPRTSGRKRQMSRKLQEAIIEHSPVPKGRRKPVIRTLEDEMKEIQKEGHNAAESRATPLKSQRRKSKALIDEDVKTPEADARTRSVEPAAARSKTSKASKGPAKTPQKRLPKIAEKGAETGVKDSDMRAEAEAAAPSPELTHPQLPLDAMDTEEAPLEYSGDDLEIPSEHLTAIRRVVLERIAGRAPTRLHGLDDEYMKIANLIEQTIVSGESNSMMIIGARGSGKTAVIDHIIQKQSVRQREDFHTVRLSGFIHTDDKIALREIWQQLGREMDVEEDTLVKNYADTLTTLLALLSHPSELGEPDAGQASKSVIFILDEFELFATHPRQTLLYNLFDIAQSRKAPIAVLGLTTRFDVAESLEKRVKSRFSHRQVHLPLAKNFASFREMCNSALLVRIEDLASPTTQSPSTLKSKLLNSSGKDTNLQTATKAWNNAITTLFTSSEALTHHLQKLYYTTKSIPDFHTSMLIPIASLDTSTSTSISTLLTTLTNTLISNTNPSLTPPDSKLHLLNSLSTLQLSLLIASARLSIIHSTETVTFAIAYDEYKNLASRARIQASAAGAMATGNASRVWSKDAAGRAWEGLVGLELVMAMGSGSGTGGGGDGGGGGGMKGNGLCRVDVGLEEIGLSGVEMGSLLNKWCREI